MYFPWLAYCLENIAVSATFNFIKTQKVKKEWSQNDQSRRTILFVCNNFTVVDISFICHSPIGKEQFCICLAWFQKKKYKTLTFVSKHLVYCILFIYSGAIELLNKIPSNSMTAIVQTLKKLFLIIYNNHDLKINCIMFSKHCKVSFLPYFWKTKYDQRLINRMLNREKLNPFEFRCNNTAYACSGTFLMASDRTKKWWGYQ